jgi:hypothetical protein
MNKKSRFRQIHTSNANYCLDVYGGLKKSNVPIISFKCHTGTNQKFLYNNKTKQIQAKHSKKCFDTKKQKVVQKKCNTRKKSQKWNYKNKKWISLKNKQCLDVMGGQYDNGSMIVYPCHKGNNQQFK